MNTEEVVTLMSSSQTRDEWNSNCNAVKKRCGGYPEFWYAAITQSGLADRIAAKWGGDAKIHIG